MYFQTLGMDSNPIHAVMAAVSPLSPINEEMLGPCLAVFLITVFLMKFLHWYRKRTKGGGW